METGFAHGSDMLVGLMIEEAFTPFGHSKTCTISNKAETKERAVKPSLEERSAAANVGKWKEKSVNGLSVEISSEGFKFYGDAMGYDKLLELWEQSQPVTVRYALRGEETTKYREGKFLITSLEEVSPSDDDATYTISMENSGPVETKVVAPKA
ncbi:phage tail tube protein [Bacteroides bouchesdurhonensis]